MRGSNRGLLLVLGVLVLVALLGPLFGGGWGMMGPGMMWGAGWSGGPGWAGGAGWGLWMLVGWLSMLAFWAAVIVGVVLLVRAVAGGDGGRTAGGDAAPTDSSALEILRRRYAAGELTRDEYERLRADLERDAVHR